jgi:hypothetical protein
MLGQRLTRTMGLLVAGALSTVLLAGCGGLSASSSCSDYLNASSSDQSAVLSSLAVQYHQPELATILGTEGVAYTCAEYPNWTLAQVAKDFGG